MIKHQLEAVGFCPPFCQSLIGTKYGKSVAQVITRSLAGGTWHHCIGKIHQTRTYGGKPECL